MENGSENLKVWMKSLVAFMLENNLTVSPVPRIRLSRKPQPEDPRFQKTGHFDPGKYEIVLFVAGRSPKDILRTLAHELVHVRQYREGRLGGTSLSGPISGNPSLRSLESEAFLLGSLALRDWTELSTFSGEDGGGGL